tara:strand:+ start:1572 stop:3326 length:1755 start_codon:yes stop_codon:yes gene_type:complete
VKLSMPVIRKLTPEISALIAAGEVIERPASVVKELVENSLDAGADRIYISTSGGGIDSIVVSDNGAGINAEEVEVAFERHSTSKIYKESDLDHISTLGFRGEALYSISSVSRMELVTRPRGQIEGVRIGLNNHVLTSKSFAGIDYGTTISVSELFSQFPARKKFFKSESAEGSRIHSMIQKFAICNPGVAFELNQGSSRSFRTSGSGVLRDVMVAIFGISEASKMIEIAGEYDQDWQGPVVSGIIGTPDQKRSNRSRIFLFVNGRLVQSRTLSFAFEQAYKGFSPDNKFPIGAITLQVPLDEVDVNVHPAKTEVRFKNESQVFSVVQGGVKSTLLTQSPVQAIANYTRKDSKFTESIEPSAFWPTALSTGGFKSPEPLSSNTIVGQNFISPYQEVLPLLRVLGQVSDTYIVCEGPDGIYMIDQHAAHERIIFEKIVADAKKETVETQMLLEPINLELDSKQEILVEENKDILNAFGMTPEPFGPNSYLIRNIPKVLAEADPRDSFHKMLSALSEQIEFKSWEDKAAYSLACHAAIRAGKKMSYREMSLLVKQLEFCLQPNNCPHGRPTMINMNKNHLEREFSRI